MSTSTTAAVAFHGSFTDVYRLQLQSANAEINADLTTQIRPYVETNRTLSGTGSLDWTSVFPAEVRGTIDPGTGNATGILDSLLLG